MIEFISQLDKVQVHSRHHPLGRPLVPSLVVSFVSKAVIFAQLDPVSIAKCQGLHNDEVSLDLVESDVGQDFTLDALERAVKLDEEFLGRVVGDDEIEEAAKPVDVEQHQHHYVEDVD